MVLIWNKKLFCNPKHAQNSSNGGLLDEKDSKIKDLAQVSKSAFLFSNTDDDLLLQTTKSTSAMDHIAAKHSASPDQKHVAIHDISTLFIRDFGDILDVHQNIHRTTIIIILMLKILLFNLE